MSQQNPGFTEALGEHVANPKEPAVGGTTVATAWCDRCRKPRPPAMSGQRCPTCETVCGQREWPVSAVELRIKGQFEAEVRRRARSAYLDVQRSDPAEASEMRSQYNIDFASGAYNWDDSQNAVNYVKVARTKTWGALFLFYLLLRRCDPDVTEQLAKEVWLANGDDAMAAYLWALGVVGNSQAPSSTGATISREQLQDVLDTEKDRLRVANRKTIDKMMTAKATAATTLPPVEATFDH